MLDKVLLNSKHWQMFLFSMVLIFINGIFLQGQPGIRGTLGGFLINWIFIAWDIALGTALMRKLSPGYRNHYILFLISGFLLVVISPVAVIFDSETDELLDSSVIYVIAFFIVFTFLGFTFLGFIARAAKSLETNSEATVAEYGGDVFLWIAYPIGVWFLQPRLNRVYRKWFKEDH